MANNYLQKQRRRMWMNNPCCENCGVLTILPEDVPGRVNSSGIKQIREVPSNMATIQHKYSRLHPKRGTNPNERVHFLWCTKCNAEESIIQEREYYRSSPLK